MDIGNTPDMPGTPDALIHSDSVDKVIRQTASLSVDASRDQVKEHNIDTTPALSTQLLDAVGLAVLGADPQGTIIYCNQAAEHMFGWHSKEMIGQQVEQLVMNCADSTPATLIIATLKQNGIWGGECELRCADGMSVPATVTIAPVYAPAGTLRAAVFMFADITEHKRSTSQLHLQASILDAINDAVIATDLSFQITSWNKAAEQVYGWKAEEVLNKSLTDILRPELPDEQRSAIERELQLGHSVSTELALYTRDDRRLTISVYTILLRDAHGICTGYVVVNHDITSRRQAEHERESLLADLATERRRWQTMVENMPDPVAVCDSLGRSVYMNPAYSNLVDRTIDLNQNLDTQSDFYQLYRSDGTLFVPQDLPLQRAALFGEWVRDVEVVQRTTEGREINCVWNAAPLFDDQGSLTGAVAVGHDVTQQRHTEQRLRISEERAHEQTARLQAVLDTTPAIIWIAHDSECREISGNRDATDLLRVGPGTNLSKTGTETGRLAHYRVHHDGVELSPIDMPMQRVAATGQALLDYAMEIVFNDGTVHSLQGNVIPVQDAMGHPAGAIGAFLDITDLKLAEDAQRESEERFRALVEVLSQAVWETDAQGNAVVDSPSWRAYTGQSVDEWLGMGWSAAVHPEDRAYAEQLWRDSVRDGTPVNAEFRLRSAMGGWRWTNMHAAPLLLPNGSIYKWVGMNIDITRRKQAEQERERLFMAETAARRQAEQAQQEAERQTALRLRFLGMISHELRTPLTSIKGFATTLLAQDVTWDETSWHEYVGIIDQEADKLTDMIDQLLDLSRIEAGTLRIDPHDQTLAPIVESAQPQLQLLTRAHTLSIDLPMNLPVVRVDAQRITQVLINLVGNAAKYSPAGTTIRVTARHQGDAVKVTVADEGLGIAPEDMPFVFEAFRRGSNGSARQTKGAGLGLAICKGLVEAHGGRIGFEQNTYSGATISFTLPVV